MNKKIINLNSKVKKMIYDQSDNFIVKNGKVYTMEGEDVSNKYNYDLIPKFKESQLKSYQSNNKMYDFEKDNGGFIFLFYQLNRSIRTLTGSLNKPAISRLLYLSTFIAYESNKIQFDNGREMTDKQLMSMLRYNKQQYNKFINALIDNELLYIDDGNKYLSDKIFWNGSIIIKNLKKENISYTRLFKKTVRELYEKTDNRDLGRLSNLYSILPYINLYNNVVCSNPSEMEPSKIIPLSLKELSDKLGYSSYERLKQAMYKTTIDDQYVFGFFTTDGDKRKYKVIVNPRVIYAGDYDELKMLTALFNASKKE